MRTVNGVIISGIEAVKIAHQKVNGGNGNWFSPATMRYWSCRVGDAVYGERYFVTSEADFSGTSRLYSIRELTDDGNISTVEFQAYANRNAAHRAAKNLADSQVVSN